MVMFISSIIILSLWEIYWTAKACWKAAQAKESYWFVFMLVFNLLGLPEIYYLHIRKDKNSLENMKNR